MKNENNEYPSITNSTTEILVISSYPPRECGIATYTQDLIIALKNKFCHSFSFTVCALESGPSDYTYPAEVAYKLDTTNATDYKNLLIDINNNEHIKLVLIQHEFGFFAKQEQAFLEFIKGLNKPVSIVFHTVLPKPNVELELKVHQIAQNCQSIIVMTNTSKSILTKEYAIAEDKISVIAHGTHLVPHLGKRFLKKKYDLNGQKVLTTFGLLSSGKGIETTIEALPEIVEKCPDVIFLVIGKTHPEVKKHEGEKYRESLELRVKELSLEKHVRFVNKYLGLPELLEYLQLTDIYLFTSNDPNQAVSGTFVYAMSCACPIISTPIPHARELLTKDTGTIIDFNSSTQLAVAANKLLSNETLRKNISTNTLQKIVSSAWENSAVAHALLFEKLLQRNMSLLFSYPAIKLDHLQQMTTQTGIIQFAKVNQPDLSTGYTLDDNARAMIATCMHYQLKQSKKDLTEIDKYLHFIEFCLQANGNFLNYVDKDLLFTGQNGSTNLNDSNGRALWALGYLISLSDILPSKTTELAKSIMDKNLVHFHSVHSTRSLAFAIKGLYYYQMVCPSKKKADLIITFANRLVQMYKHESEKNWNWFESYLTYANSILPEAMLYAYLLTKEAVYKDIAISSLDFLLSKTFNGNGIEVISNREWLQKGEEAGQFGEQPIDVAYTILTLDKFYLAFEDESYKEKMEIAFDWFLGNNRLQQIIYNPCTGGCYDGLEENNVNLNQGAESTVSYLMTRFCMEKYRII